MNRNQIIGVGISLVAAFLAFTFPPYYDDGGLIGGTVYFPFQKPPSDPSISFNGWLLNWELGFVGLSLCAMLIAFRPRARGRQKRALSLGYTLEIVFLVCNLPSFKYILAPEFTWLALNLMAVMLLGLVLLLGRGQDGINATKN